MREIKGRQHEKIATIKTTKALRLIEIRSHSADLKIKKEVWGNENSHPHSQRKMDQKHETHEAFADNSTQEIEDGQSERSIDGSTLFHDEKWKEKEPAF